jgi:hypothetical protein
MTRPPRSDLFERILGATGFEPRVAVYLLPYFGRIDRSTFVGCSRLAAILHTCHPRLVNGFPQVA